MIRTMFRQLERQIRQLRRWMLLSISLLIALPASGQVIDVEPYYVVPTSEQVLLRCSDGISWYPTAQVTRETLLRVDGSAGDWLRVNYPSDAPAVISIEEAEHRSADSMVELTRASRLRAFNRGDQIYDECFKALLPDRLMPGTTLAYMGTIEDRQGETAGYLVQAPESARAYVLKSQVREASEQEIRELTDAAPPAKSQTPADDQAGDNASDPGRQMAEDTPADDSAEAMPDEAMSDDSDEPAPSRSTLATGDSPSETTDDTLIMGEQAPSTAQREEGQLDVIVTVEKLDESFAALAKEPLPTAEFEPLKLEYQQLKTTLTEEQAPLAQYIDQRIELLTMRTELQRVLAESEQLQESAQQTTQEFEKAAADRAARLQDYLLVGRLSASTLYDGRRLPLLYRLMSVDGAANRTLAYLTPVKDLALDGKLGAIVGVKGEGSLDPGARVQVIQPTHVDVLERSAAGTGQR